MKKTYNLFKIMFFVDFRISMKRALCLFFLISAVRLAHPQRKDFQQKKITAV